MKALFYMVNSLDNVPNLGAELDLVQKHLDVGDEVVIIRCTGQLPACNVNPDRWESKCYRCQRSLDLGLNALKPGPAGNKPTVITLAELIPEAMNYSALPQSFQSMAELEKFELDGIHLGAAAVSSVVTKTKEHKLNVGQFERQIRNALQAGWMAYNAAQTALSRFQPDRVYMFNGRLAEIRPVTEVCRKRDIPFYAIDRAGDFGRYNLFHNALAIDRAYIQRETERLWEEGEEPPREKTEMGAAWFEAKRSGKSTGDKAYTAQQQANLLPEAFDDSRHNIAVFTTSEFEFVGEETWKYPFYVDQNEAIGRLAEDLKNQPDIHLWVRVHPNMANRRCTQLDELRALAEAGFKNLHIIWPESPVSSYDLMDASDTVLTFGSTVGVEAAFWGKPSVLAGHALYEDLGCCYRPKSHQEVAFLMTEKLKPLPADGAIRYGYRMMKNGMPYRYFEQTGYYTGNFHGETFSENRILGGWPGRLYHYYLRKRDKWRTQASSGK